MFLHNITSFDPCSAGQSIIRTLQSEQTWNEYTNAYLKKNKLLGLSVRIYMYEYDIGLEWIN